MLPSLVYLPLERICVNTSPISRSENVQLNTWVEACVQLCEPDAVHWCDGSDTEYEMLVATMLADGTLLPLNPESYPGCYLHRSHPSDVARTEKSTYICNARPRDAGPINHWMS